MRTEGAIRAGLCALLMLACGSNALAQDLLIENVTVIGSTRQSPLVNSNVLIRDGRIAEIGTARVTSSRDVRRLDGRGKYLTPGIMDSHVHVSSTPGLPDETPASGKHIRDLRNAYFTQQPRSYLYFGVTQVVDLLNTAQGLAAFESQPLHPDLYHCGAAPVVDGYGLETWLDQKTRYRNTPNYIFEPANQAKHPLPAGAKAEEHTPEAAVQRIAESGAICVKVFIEDGFGARSDLPILSNALLQRVRTAAHQRGLLVLAHANAVDMLRIAVANNVDVIAHGTWNWLEADRKPGVPEAIATPLREVHRKNIGFQPTVQVIQGLGAMFDPATLEDPQYSKVVPSTMMMWYRTDEAQFFVDMERSWTGSGTTDAQRREMYNRIGEQGMRAMKYLHDLGHPLLLGSDTPAAPTYGNQPGYNTYREMQMWARAGIPPRAIFDAATINNARQFRLEKDYGTIERGKVGNLLLLQANPLESAQAWGAIETVILRGQAIDRATLAAR
jgi:imidazolonepropionase-like amidohydrolase